MDDPHCILDLEGINGPVGAGAIVGDDLEHALRKAFERFDCGCVRPGRCDGEVGGDLDSDRLRKAIESLAPL
jgi:hypothetical protein